MIYIVENIDSPLAAHLKNDPVRPHIPHDKRFGANGQVLAYGDSVNPHAMVCVKFCDAVPSSEEELISNQAESPSIAVFYTVWSYKLGAGQKLILEALDLIKHQKPNVNRFVTLSPPTETARRFHLRNGAFELKVNADTINYEYLQHR